MLFRYNVDHHFFQYGAISTITPIRTTKKGERICMIEFDVGLNEFGAELEHGKDGPELTGTVLLYLLMLYFPVLCSFSIKSENAVLSHKPAASCFLFVYLFMDLLTFKISHVWIREAFCYCGANENTTHKN